MAMTGLILALLVPMGIGLNWLLAGALEHGDPLYRFRVVWQGEEPIRGPSRDQCREWRTDTRSHEPYRVLVGTVEARDGQEADLLVEAGREGTTCAHRVPCRFIIRTPEGDEGIGYSENEAAEDLFEKRPDLRPHDPFR